MIIIRKTEHYVRWLNNLRDIKARARILVRIERLADGNPGDVKPGDVKPGDVKPGDEGVSELRINYGPGYRVYFKNVGQELVILLAGGIKRTQSSDIKKALNLACNL